MVARRLSDWRCDATTLSETNARVVVTLIAEDLTAWECAEFGKVEVEVPISVIGRIAVAPRRTIESCERRRAVGARSAIQRQPLPVLPQFDLEAVDLSFQQAVLVLVSFLCLGKIVDFGLEIFEMPLLPLAKCALCSSVLCFAFL